MNFITQHWEGIVALLAMLATAVSSYFAYRTFHLQRIRNVKSVRPILLVGQWDYENRVLNSHLQCILLFLPFCIVPELISPDQNQQKSAAQ